MPPEMLRGLPYGLSADAWSLGVILYTLLCGASPFAQATPCQLGLGVGCLSLSLS